MRLLFAEFEEAIRRRPAIRRGRSYSLIATSAAGMSEELDVASAGLSGQNAAANDNATPRRVNMNDRRA